MSTAGLVLHVGMSRGRVDSAAQVARVATQALVVDGDGWEAWGESPGTDVNDADTLHVQFLLPPVAARWHAQRILDRLNGESLLVPMQATYQAGVVGVVTSVADWSEVARTWSASSLTRGTS